MGTKPKTAPKLFGIHAPKIHGETLVIWQVAGLTFRVLDRGRTWAFEGLYTLAGGYETKSSAKRALERHIRREHKALGKVMGL
jgi:hypothetical protein